MSSDIDSIEYVPKKDSKWDTYTMNDMPACDGRYV
jgi:hypothetical protein